MSPGWVLPAFCLVHRCIVRRPAARRSWWKRAWRLIWCTMMPLIHHQARIHHKKNSGHRTGELIEADGIDVSLSGRPERGADAGTGGRAGRAGERAGPVSGQGRRGCGWRTGRRASRAAGRGPRTRGTGSGRRADPPLGRPGLARATPAFGDGRPARQAQPCRAGGKGRLLRGDLPAVRNQRVHVDIPRRGVLARFPLIRVPWLTHRLAPGQSSSARPDRRPAQVPEKPAAEAYTPPVRMIDLEIDSYRTYYRIKSRPARPQSYSN